MPRQYEWKLVAERLAALALLCGCGPLLILIALAIRADSPGPALFRQDRTGRYGRKFRIHKFRTMVVDAPHLGTGVFTSQSDPRITRIGRLLRRTSLDELPQLIDIVCGHMSFVGPRPPLTHHPRSFHEYRPRERLRFSVAPGITGLAQVRGRNRLSWPERFELDLEYVQDWSLRGDLRLLLQTFRVLADRGGIYNLSSSGGSAGSQKR